MNNRFKNQKGVTLITLMVTVVILLIVSNIVIYSIKDNLGIEKLKYMQNDIENLNDKVSAYYKQYGALPIKIKYTNITNISNAGLISDKIDKGDFYVLDLSALENLTLTYGEDYKKIVHKTTEEITEEEINNLKDIYIINETSHNIFYVKGVKLNDEVFYTNFTKENVDKEQADLRYIDNIKIPEGYLYIEGTKASGIRIKNASDETKTYKWTEVNNKITEIPSDITINTNENEKFINSVNAYNGYYKSENDNSVVYLPLDEKWSEQYDKDSIYKDKNGDTVFIPKGFCVSKLEGENQISKGLVIKNSNTNDRYVWVEVPKTIYETAQSETDYEKIEKDMINYAIDYRDDNYTDSWYDGCGISSDTEYNDLKNKMLKSVYNKGGFWISQYEIGSDTVATSNNTTRKATSQEDRYPYNHITCNQAQSLATNMDSQELTSSLLFGIQWNLTLRFIEENGGAIKSHITTNSESWGNYQNSKFNIYRGKYSTDNGTNYTGVTEKYEKINSSNILITTGNTKRNSALNIYDLAGNLYEFTLEKSNDSSNPCVVRGGDFRSAENNANSNHNETITAEYYYCGFRTCLY